jgi:hypothetical protein
MQLMRQFRSIGQITSLALITLLLVASSAATFPRYQVPKYESKSNDNQPFYKGGVYDSAIPKPEGRYNLNPDARPIRVHEIESYFKALAESSDRVQLFEYGRTYENRPLLYLVISSEANMAKLQDHKAAIGQLANPESITTNSGASNIIANTPAITWLAYSIHGDEISGSDASIEIAYQLAAGMDDRSKMLRDSLIVIIDPSENPDGRERYLTMLQSHATDIKSTDNQALQHSGFWPWGRGNHYLFDLNRDWILLENVETRDKVAAIIDWNPQMLVDAHEMGANSSFLFNPPREPINRNIPDTIKGWWNTIARDHADAFDEYGWNYYTKEWHEEWYPGYGSAWANYIGAIGLLYEQSGADGLPTKQRDGYIQTYREAVHHQFVSSIANITTAAKHRTEVLGSFYKIKTDAVQAGRSDTPRRFVIPRGMHPERADNLANTLLGYGARVERTTAAGKVSGARDGYGKTHRSLNLATGSYVINLDQPLRPIIKAALEFDMHFSKEFLEEERREQEKWGDSRLYEFSAWSLSLAYDAEVVWTDNNVTAPTEVISEVAWPTGTVNNPNGRYGWVIDYTSDQAPIAAIRLLSKGYKVQSAEKAFRAEGIEYSPGSLVIRRKYNDASVQNYLQELATELGIEVNGVNSGLVQSGSDLGADSFRGLELPRIGLFGGNGVSITSYGSLWHHLDQELKVGHSILDLGDLAFMDLDRYNVLIIPSIWGGRGAASQLIGQRGLSKLKDWVSDGGTLICVDGAASWATDSSNGLTSVRTKRDVLAKLDEYAAENLYELFQSSPTVDTNQIWNYKTPTSDDSEKKAKSAGGDSDTQKRLDRRTRSLFQPRGVIFDVMLDNERWPAFGCDTHVPAGLYTGYAYMSKSPVETIGRIEDAEACRLSGLLWPEARERWANSAYMTRERNGSGQVILFAGDPDFRGYWKGTARLFTNCLALGPGFGTGVSTGW